MNIISRLKYICSMYFVVMVLGGPLDLFFNFGMIEFFTTSWSFMLFPFFWLLAPWLERLFPAK